MESPPDPANDPGSSVSEPATPVMDMPVNLETFLEDGHQTPVRRQSSSSSNKGKLVTLDYFITALIAAEMINREVSIS